MCSKYDVIKLKVYVDDDHYYILSRFRLAHILGFCKVPLNVAAQMALNVKRHFVNHNRTTITQKELEEEMEMVMSESRYGAAYSMLLPVIIKFYLHRLPLIVMVAGNKGCGKTTMAHILSNKLHCHTIIDVETLLDIVHFIDCTNDESCKTDLAYTQTESLLTRGETERRERYEEETEREHLEEVMYSHQLEKAIKGLINQAIENGKVMILEGEHLELSLFEQYLTNTYQKDHNSIVIAIYLKREEANCNSMPSYERNNEININKKNLVRVIEPPLRQELDVAWADNVYDVDMVNEQEEEQQLEEEEEEELEYELKQCDCSSELIPAMENKVTAHHNVTIYISRNDCNLCRHKQWNTNNEIEENSDIAIPQHKNWQEEEETKSSDTCVEFNNTIVINLKSLNDIDASADYVHELIVKRIINRLKEMN